MRYNTKGIISKINKKVDLDKNLIVYANELLTNYYQYSLVGLSLNYYALYETVYDNDKYTDGHIQDNVNNINDIILKYIINVSDNKLNKEAIEEIDKLRIQILRRSDIIADYIEKLFVYEYILNRVEYRFDNSSSEIGNKVINDEEISRNIFRYIFSVKDNMVVNDRIKSIVGQLPIRMAKTKFYDLIANSLTLYKGTDVASLESFLYTIRSSSTIYKAKSTSKYFTDIKEVIEYFGKIDYANIDETVYKDARNKLDECTKKLNSLFDTYCAIQEVVNKVYAILLSTPYNDGSGYSKEDDMLCKSILKDINNLFTKKTESKNVECFDELEEKINKSFIKLEGKQENWYYECAILESELLPVIEEHGELIKSLDIIYQFDCMKKCQLLLSSSLFAELKDDKNAQIIADEDYVNNVTGRIISELSDLFANCSTIVRRAIMANVLNKLPVFFVNSNETMQYISTSLASCKDEAEKRASIDLINELIYNDEISYGEKKFDKFDFEGLE